MLWICYTTLMRLYLSSFRNGNKPEELLKLLGEARRTGVICNAMDMVEEGARRESNDREVERIASIGLEPEILDLREYFGKTDELRERLSHFDCIWSRGGNTFILRRAYKQSGFDEILKDLLEKDAIVYAGYSAGICLLAPTLRGLDLVDQPVTVPTPEGYEAETIWDGLGLIPYSIAPHYKSDHPESADVDKTVEYFEEHHMPHKTLRDGEAIVIDGEKEWIAA